MGRHGARILACMLGVWAGAAQAHLPLSLLPLRLKLGERTAWLERAPRLTGLRALTPGRMAQGNVYRNRLERMTRTGYGYGLPIPEEAVRLEDSFPLTSYGSLVLAAGLLPVLHMESTDFREQMGARRYRYRPVPGLVLRPAATLPVQVGVSLLPKPPSPNDASLQLRPGTGALQLCGRF